MGGSLTGASMNPARSVGPALAEGVVEGQWLYLVVPVLGALLGAFAYRAVACGSIGLGRRTAWPENALLTASASLGSRGRSRDRGRPIDNEARGCC